VLAVCWSCSTHHFRRFAAICNQLDNKFGPDGHTVVAGEPADQRWWSGDQTCCLACAASSLFGICCGYHLPQDAVSAQYACPTESPAFFSSAYRSLFSVLISSCYTTVSLATRSEWPLQFFVLPLTLFLTLGIFAPESKQIIITPAAVATDVQTKIDLSRYILTQGRAMTVFHLFYNRSCVMFDLVSSCWFDCWWATNHDAWIRREGQEWSMVKSAQE